MDVEGRGQGPTGRRRVAPPSFSSFEDLSVSGRAGRGGEHPAPVCSPSRGEARDGRGGLAPPRGEVHDGRDGRDGPVLLDLMVILICYFYSFNLTPNMI